MPSPMRSLEKLRLFEADRAAKDMDCGTTLVAVFIIIDAQRLAMFKV